jgi:hypothetical protein
MLKDSKAQSPKKKDGYIKKENLKKIVNAVLLLVGAKNVEQFNNVIF